MKIDKSIPLPKAGASVGRKAEYPWPSMDVGDSVFFDNEPGGSHSRPVWAAKAWFKSKGMKVSIRKEGDGVRIWRIE